MASQKPTAPPIGILVMLSVALIAGPNLLAHPQGQAPSQPPAGPSGGVAGSEPKFRLIRAVAGTKGHEDAGGFVIEDPRTVFNTAADQKVIVYFEWEGDLGAHHFEGFWKNPEGKIVVMSDFSYIAKQRRFGAYWTLTISEGILTGLWALEAHVDGEVAGVETFQIVSGPPTAQPAVKNLPSRAEIYKRSLASTLDVQRLSSTGEVLGTGSAFVVSDTAILTAYDVIDCATSIRVVTPDGKPAVLAGILAADRREDWVLLKVTPLGIPPMPLAKPDSWAVGDEYYSLDVSPAGGRTLVEGNITGMNDFPEFGKRTHLSLSVGRASSGSPVLNEAGEVIGIMTFGSLLPGVASIESNASVAYPMNLAGQDSPTRLNEVLAIPISAVRIPDAATPATDLASFARGGGLIAPLSPHSRLVDTGTLAKEIKRQGPVPHTEGEKFDYSRAGGQVMVFLWLNPTEKIRSQLVFRIYDMNNRLTAQTKASKLSLDPNKRVNISGALDVRALEEGTYRVDVFVGDDVIWRTFFRLAS